MVRREYTEEFKLEAIKLVKETGQTIAKIGRDLGSVDKILEKPYERTNEI